MFINVKQIEAKDLPKGGAGLVLHINHKQEVVGCTATEDAYKRCSPAKMQLHHLRALENNVNWFKNNTTMSSQNIKLMTRYPEAWLQLSYQPMDYELAVALRKRIKKLLDKIS